jgi:hemoglobin-like flavoprotein
MSRRTPPKKTKKPSARRPGRTAPATAASKPRRSVAPKAPSDIELVEASFGRFASRGDTLVERFYARLFEANPGVRAMFPDDIALQKKKLLGALVLAVQNLRKPDVLAPVLVELGKKHVAYGAATAHFAPVGAALLGALDDVDPHFDAATRDAWARTYGTVTEIMTRGMTSVA